jgi:hypothetical protein
MNPATIQQFQMYKKAFEQGDFEALELILVAAQTNKELEKLIIHYHKEFEADNASLTAEQQANVLKLFDDTDFVS